MKNLLKNLLPLNCRTRIETIARNHKAAWKHPLDTIIITKFNNTTPPKPKSIEELKNNDQKQTK